MNNCSKFGLLLTTDFLYDSYHFTAQAIRDEHSLQEKINYICLITEVLTNFCADLIL